MSQRRIESILEIIVSTIAGLVVKYVFLVILLYILNIDSNLGANITITLTMEGVGALKNYLVRRWFEKGIKHKLRAYLRNKGIMKN